MNQIDIGWFSIDRYIGSFWLNKTNEIEECNLNKNDRFTAFDRSLVRLTVVLQESTGATANYGFSQQV